jgi:flavodoxin
MILNEAQSDMTKVIGAFTVYKFIKLMATPFRQMDAYKFGIIDSKGKFLKKSEELTSSKEKKSVDVFNRLIINLKKLVKKIPDPSLQAQLKNVATAMILIKEESEKIGADGDFVVNEIRKYLSNEGIDINSIEINDSFEKLIKENKND